MTCPMRSGSVFGCCCPLIRRAAAGGLITGRCSTGSCSGPGRAARGGTCRRGSGTGRRSITGIAAGRWMAAGSRSWTGCGPGVMRPRARTGRSAPIRRSTAPISTRPGPAASRPLTTSRGALANDKKSGREAIGRSRGGLTTKIHLAADLRCRPVARLTSPGQHGDSPRFIPLMDAIRVRRRGPGRPRRRPNRAMAGKAYSAVLFLLPARPGRRDPSMPSRFTRRERYSLRRETSTRRRSPAAARQRNGALAPSPATGGHVHLRSQPPRACLALSWTSPQRIGKALRKAASGPGLTWAGTG